jgi:hypothetical protein
MVTFLAWILAVQSSQASAQPQGARGQEAATTADNSFEVNELPDAPDLALARAQEATTGAAQAAATEAQQTKRILWVFPNFRSVSVNSHPPAQTPKEKFTGFRQDSFDYSSFILVGLLAGVSQLQGSTPEFHTGAPAYGRYYWHNFADQTDENLWVDFVLPVALRQDARYYTLGRGTAKRGDGHRGSGHNGIAKRAGYAFTRMLVTRTDSGGSNFNYSEVVGAGAAAGISDFYYPSADRTWTKTGQRWALNVGLDGATFIIKEFWPDLNHAIFHNK